MDVVGVMAAYLSVMPVFTAQSREAIHTCTTGKYATITLTTPISTD